MTGEPQHFDVVIVGGGHGGARAAMALRQHGFSGTVAIVGDEAELPYERPPLSKEYLAGDRPWDKMVFRSAEAWAEKQIMLCLGQCVVAVDATDRCVTTARGDTIGYGTLIWAAGGSPRSLVCAGRDAMGVHTVRNRADVDRMMREMPGVREAVVIGGGYIGLEAASALIKLGKRVTLLEAQQRVLARVAGEPLSRFYEQEHRRHGVDVRLGAEVACILEESGRVRGVRMADQSEIAAQMVVVGIGIVPSVVPLIAAGAEGGNGVRVDTRCRTSLDGVFAIGDCAEHRNSFARDAWVRLESVQNAHDQAAVAAATIAGGGGAYDALPWFWSNQYDLRLQTAGLARDHDEIVLRGAPETGSFSLIYLRDGEVIALDCVNNPRDFAHGRLLVAARTRGSVTQLADSAAPLKTLLG